MKLHFKLTLITSLAALATSPLALANKDAAAAAEPTVCAEPVDGSNHPHIDKEGEVSVCQSVDDTPVIAVIDKEGGVDPAGPADDAGAAEPDTVADNSGEGNAVPIDWVKRGGGDVTNPDVIFYNMAGASPVVFKGEQAPVAKEIGQDEKAVGLETKGNAVVSQINREKKGPLALLKKGRVFLR
jgi:hypothetical protein